jgi:hypothetical protein
MKSGSENPPAIKSANKPKKRSSATLKGFLPNGESLSQRDLQFGR